MSGINDEKLEKLLTVVGHYTLETLEEVVPFNDLADETREVVMKASLKSMEVASIIALKLCKTNELNFDKLEQICVALEEKDFALANNLLNK